MRNSAESASPGAAPRQYDEIPVRLRIPDDGPSYPILLDRALFRRGSSLLVGTKPCARLRF